MENGQNFYELLGLEPQASQAEISKAFRALVREYHPDRFEEKTRKAEAETVLKDITEAYNTLRRPYLRAKYDQSLSTGESKTAQKSIPEQVRELLPQGKSRLRSGDLGGALAVFDHILRLDPENVESMFNAGMIRMKFPKWRAEGGAQVEEAIERDPFTASYVIQYATFLIENGQALRAQRLLENALPSHPKDEKIASLLDKVRGGKSSGFSFFGKKP
jgi:curved DNA-binding protein CbpA